MSCCEDLRWGCRDRCQDKRNLLAAAVSGLLFFSGWWLLFDVSAQRPAASQFKGVYYLCGLAGTLGGIIINLVTRAHLRGENYQGGCLGPCGFLFFLFLGFVTSFAAMIGAGWILFADYVIPGKETKYYGVAVFLQNLLILGSSLIFKFGRGEEEDWMGY